MDVHLNFGGVSLTPRVQALTMKDGRSFLVLELTHQADVILPHFDADAITTARALADVLIAGADALERTLTETEAVEQQRDHGRSKAANTATVSAEQTAAAASAAAETRMLIESDTVVWGTAPDASAL